jgi:hypothetical protein
MGRGGEKLSRWRQIQIGLISSSTHATGLSMTKLLHYLSLLVCFSISALAMSAPALALDPPTGKIVLTVTGNITDRNDGNSAQFDMAMLEQFPQHEITAQTPWYAKPVTFTGPLLRDVLNSLGAKGQTLNAAAIDAYSADIPFADMQKYDVIVSRLLNGKPVSVRENGPLFIMYPLGTDPTLDSKLILDRCVWQLKSIDVE